MALSYYLPATKVQVSGTVTSTPVIGESNRVSWVHELSKLDVQWLFVPGANYTVEFKSSSWASDREFKLQFSPDGVVEGATAKETDKIIPLIGSLIKLGAAIVLLEVRPDVQPVQPSDTDEIRDYKIMKPKLDRIAALNTALKAVQVELDRLSGLPASSDGSFETFPADNDRFAQLKTREEHLSKLLSAAKQSLVVVHQFNSYLTPGFDEKDFFGRPIPENNTETLGDKKWALEIAHLDLQEKGLAIPVDREKEKQGPPPKDPNNKKDVAAAASRAAAELARKDVLRYYEPNHVLARVKFHQKLIEKIVVDTNLHAPEIVLRRSVTLPEFCRLKSVSLGAPLFTDKSTEIVYHPNGTLKTVGSGSSGSGTAGAVSTAQGIADAVLARRAQQDVDDAASSEVARLKNEVELLELQVKLQDAKAKLGM